mmetsp:Transcript_22650/g.36659  ORF Transcript_22650/g.36659 Transcript_22650/m.36659 type:complete len:441 (+) Transcript_22650:121-1443(+)
MQLIQRVTTTFLVKVWQDSLRVAVFRRVGGMPTFPNKFAGISGSMEAGETPWETARRELQEETNWNPGVHSSDYKEPSSEGLFVDVEYTSPRSHQTRTIRVYPFTVNVPESFDVSLKGTEHDQFKWVTVKQLDELDDQGHTVPLLAQAFHHATAGRYHPNVTDAERAWASDQQNGASTMSRRALELIREGKGDPSRMRMLRPSMVTIVNSMNSVNDILSRQPQQSPSSADATAAVAEQVLKSLDAEAQRTIDYAVDELLNLYRERKMPLKVCTFSRSSTLVSILMRLLEESPESLQLPVLCSRSIPGAEGEAMARDLNDGVSSSVGKVAVCVEDDRMNELLHSENSVVDVVLIGADCVLEDESAVINKVGSTALTSLVSSSKGQDTSRCQVFCCTDRFKWWQDKFPPPLEKDLFELVPIPNHIDRLLVPPPQAEVEKANS